MFQYSTETILNDLNGVGLYKTDALVVNGVGFFKKEFVTEAYKNAYIAEAKEKIQVTTVTKGLVAGDTLRLRVDAKLVGEQSADFADALVRYKKAYLYEVGFEAGDTPTTINAKFVKAFKMDKSISDNVRINITASEANLVIEATDCYVRFDAVEIARVPAKTIEGAVTGWQEYDVIAKWDGKSYMQKGTEGAGTTTRLIKNLRLPTDARNAAFSTFAGGRPIPGVGYDQFTLIYTVENKNLGAQAVGAVDKSMTTHTLFIPTTLSSTFEEKLTALGITPKVVSKEGGEGKAEEDIVPTTKAMNAAIAAAIPAAAADKKA